MKNDNPPAFPNTGNSAWSMPPTEGMSLRDWFAGQCDVASYCPLSAYEGAHRRKPTIAELAEYIAQIRFIEADAMLAARDNIDSLAAAGEGGTK